jgi:coenzyme PQQ synthesis protein D (PqqD)
MHPKARRTDLIVNRVADETVVYDTTTAKAHALNPAAALVFENADGETSTERLAAIMASELGTPADEELAEMALQRLSRAGLLTEQFTPRAGPGKITRRQMMKRLGVAALALPLITSIAAPTPAMAQSASGNPAAGGAAGGTSGAGTQFVSATGGTRKNGHCCSSDSQCLSGRCLDFGIGGLCVNA